jgi:HK97 family phage prohead protease
MLDVAGFFISQGRHMTIQHKTFTAELVSKSDAGGRITISTAGCDRDRDRVMSRGAVLENYLKNPVVMWGHSYGAPADVIGRTVNLDVQEGGITADFELRPAANDQDPQNIVRLLWDGGWVRTASIGFRPIEMQPNEYGGNDITAWELLEWSLVPIPANQDALRLAAKALDMTSGDVQKDAAPEGDTPAPVVETTPADGKQDAVGDDSEGIAPPVGDAAADAINAVEAAQELRLAAILADFVSAIRPYLAVDQSV